MNSPYLAGSIKKGRNSEANLKSKFNIKITEDIQSKLMTEQKPGPPRVGREDQIRISTLYGPSFCSIPIEEWDL